MTVPDPVDPVTEDDCLHCEGSGTVEDEWSPDGYTSVGFTAECDRCDGSGRAPVDAHGRCACEDCLHLPYDHRLGSDRPWCESRYRTFYLRIVGCVLEEPHRAHLSARDALLAGPHTWWDVHAYQEPDQVTPLQPSPPPADV